MANKTSVVLSRRVIFVSYFMAIMHGLFLKAILWLLYLGYFESHFMAIIHGLFFKAVMLYGYKTSVIFESHFMAIIHGLFLKAIIWLLYMGYF